MSVTTKTTLDEKGNITSIIETTNYPGGSETITMTFVKCNKSKKVNTTSQTNHPEPEEATRGCMAWNI